MSGWIVNKTHQNKLVKFMKMINKESNIIKIREDVIKQVENLKID